MRKSHWIAVIVVLVLLAIDQAVKIYIKTSFFPGEIKGVFGDWFSLHYIENQGMAFGFTLGGSIYAKLLLSLFRVVAIVAIAYYLFKEISKKVGFANMLALCLILAGAIGNLIDSMCYDYLFGFDTCLRDNYGNYWNELAGSGNKVHCDGFPMEVRNHGFLFGNVVDMFQFDAYWPKWMPWVGGEAVFPAIWNVADTFISVGVGLMILLNRKTLFSFKKSKADSSGNY